MDIMTLGYETPLTLFLFGIGFFIVLYAQVKISSTYQKEKLKKSKRKLSGVEVARMILDANGLSDVHVVAVKGELTDHYDPNRKVIRLSHDVFDGTSLASIAVAAHECGHAIQDKEEYLFLKIRSTLVPIVNFVTYTGYFVSIISLFAGITSYLLVGILLVLASLIFQLVTLPVEINASKRAEEELAKLDIIEKYEKEDIHAMLKAAALTYVASFINTILQLLRMVLMFQKRDD